MLNMGIRGFFIVITVALGAVACSNDKDDNTEINLDEPSLSISNSQPPSTSDPRELNTNTLDTHAEQCRNKMLPGMTAPETVEWEPGYEWGADSEGDFFTIEGKMTAENQSGVRGDLRGWWCEFSWNGSNWQMTDYFSGDRDMWLNEESDHPTTVSWTMPPQEDLERGYAVCQDKFVESLIGNELLIDRYSVVDLGGNFQANTRPPQSGTFYGSFTADGIPNPYEWKCDATMRDSEWVVQFVSSNW